MQQIIDLLINKIKYNLYTNFIPTNLNPLLFNYINFIKNKFSLKKFDYPIILNYPSTWDKLSNNINLYIICINSNKLYNQIISDNRKLILSIQSKPNSIPITIKPIFTINELNNLLNSTLSTEFNLILFIPKIIDK
jgi:hypothetical protein